MKWRQMLLAVALILPLNACGKPAGKSPSAPTSNKWVDYKSDDGGFTIQFPATPTAHPKNILGQTTVEASAGQLRCAVTFKSVSFENDEAKKSYLDDLKNPKHTGGIKDSKEIERHGLPGVRLTQVAEAVYEDGTDDSHTATWITLLTPDSEYTLRVDCPSDEFDLKTVDKFFDSFQPSASAAK